MAIVTVSGRSGSGKDVLVKQLLAVFPKAQRLESITTREPRLGETNSGYRHVGELAFAKILGKGEFVWDTGKFGNRYGTRAEIVDEALEVGLFFAAITAESVCKLHDHALRRGLKHRVRSVYLFASDEEVLRGRMIKRGDDAGSVESRISQDRGWDEAARLDPNRYLYVDCLDELGDKVRRVDAWLHADIQDAFSKERSPCRFPLP